MQFEIRLRRPTMGLIGLFWVGVVKQRGELWPGYALFVTYIVFSMALALIFHVLPRSGMFVESLRVPFAATGLIYVCTKLSGVIPTALLDPVLRENSASAFQRAVRIRKLGDYAVWRSRLDCV